MNKYNASRHTKECVYLYFLIRSTYREFLIDVGILSVTSLLVGDYCLWEDGDPDYGGISPMVRAAYRGWNASVELLLEFKVPFREGTLRRALSAAIENTHNSVVLTLVKAGARIPRNFQESIDRTLPEHISSAIIYES